MPSIPAFCNKCGASLNSGIFIENSTNVTLSNNRVGYCPKCGSQGHTLDGTFDFIDNSIKILSASTRTIDELSRLENILNEAIKEKQSQQFISKRIKDEIPTLANFSILVPKNTSDLYTFLTFVLTLVIYLTPFFQSHQKLPELSTDQIVEMIVHSNELGKQQIRHEKTYNSSNTKKQASSKVKNSGEIGSVLQKGQKIGRNDPCPCGSGSKYKKCHGANK